MRLMILIIWMLFCSITWGVTTNPVYYVKPTGQTGVVDFTQTTFKMPANVQFPDISTTIPSTYYGESRYYRQQSYLSNNRSNMIIVAGSGKISYNDGVTWSNVATLPARFRIKGSTNGKYLYAGTEAEGGDATLYKSSDYGLTWATVGVSGNYLDCSYDGKKVILSGTSIKLSSDYGVSWVTNDPAADPSYPTYYGCAMSSNSSVLFVSYVGAVDGYRSYDFGTNWSSISSFYSKQEMDCSDDGNIVFTCDGSGKRIYRSITMGSNWSVIVNLTQKPYWLQCSTNGAIILASNQDADNNPEQYYSIDYGTNWTTKTVIPLYENLGIGLSPSGKYIFLCTGSSGLIQSLDYGVTWTTNAAFTGLKSVGYFNTTDAWNITTNSYYTNILTTSGTSGVFTGGVFWLKDGVITNWSP